MTRKEDKVTITAEGRDKGKTFLIVEMPSSKAEAWANRAIFAVLTSNPKIPPDLEGQGMAGIARLGLEILAGVRTPEALELLNELMECVSIVEPHAVRVPTDDDIREVKTRWHLKAEVFRLHTGFSIADEVSSWISAARETALRSLATRTSGP